MMFQSCFFFTGSRSGSHSRIGTSSSPPLSSASVHAVFNRPANNPYKYISPSRTFEYSPNFSCSTSLDRAYYRYHTPPTFCHSSGNVKSSSCIKPPPNRTHTSCDNILIATLNKENLDNCSVSNNNELDQQCGFMRIFTRSRWKLRSKRRTKRSQPNESITEPPPVIKKPLLQKESDDYSSDHNSFVDLRKHRSKSFSMRDCMHDRNPVVARVVSDYSDPSSCYSFVWHYYNIILYFVQCILLA